MSWLLTILLLAVGLVLIVKGGDAFVDAASWMAEKTGIPKLIIGATVVSLATTLPEMLVSFLAAADGKVDMAIGNAVGSVTVNIGLIMGLALICMPCVIKRSDYLLKSLLMLGAALVLLLFGFTGSIGALPGVLLLGIFAVAMVDNVRQAKGGVREEIQCRELPQGASCSLPAQARPSAPEEAALLAPRPDGTLAAKAAAWRLPTRDTVLHLVKFVVGAAAIIAGSNLLIDNGSAMALLLGVPERIIAVSVVAIGTSLPELVTTLTAIRKKESCLSVGNVIGANIIDLTLILPVSALLAGKPLEVSPAFALVDLPACLAVSCIALVPTLVTKKFHRAQGVVMVIFYLAYLAFTTLMVP